jgi:hypothetical protein
MKQMKLVVAFLFISALVVCFFGCGDDPKPSSFNGTWRLYEVVNISDENKYLNAVLELGSDKKYKLISNAGTLVGQGSWEHEQDTLQLDFWLFENTGGVGRYGVSRSDNNSMTLKQRYTLDNKNAVIEYLFVKNE